jgi:hypothetical protein
MGWLSLAQLRRLVGSSPAIWVWLGPARKKEEEIFLQKLFQKYIYIIFCKFFTSF